MNDTLPRPRNHQEGPARSPGGVMECTGEMTDECLLQAVAGGDAPALRHLYTRHSGLLFAIILRVLRDRHEAEDALQETFLRIWKQAGQFRAERGTGKTWMSFLARNVAIDLLRRRERRFLVIDGEATEEAEVPSQGATHAELGEISACMAGLTEPQREALELAYFKGNTQSEIAELMKVPLGNVKNHLKRGLLKLRQLHQRHD